MVINHIDCFSGPGGICTGFRAAGINTILAIEKVKSCVDTYTANHPHVHVIHKDIREVGDDEVLRIIGNNPIHIVSSGMPCETFSTAGSKSRSSYDFRQQLYSEAIRIAKAVNSKIIMFENVPAITSKRVVKGGERKVIEDIREELIDNGYRNIYSVILNSLEFGVPQTRSRFFLLASADEQMRLFRPFPEKNVGKLTVASALAGLPPVNANEKIAPSEYEENESDYSALLKNQEFWGLSPDRKATLTYHIPPKHRPGMIERFKLLDPGESLIDLFKKFDCETVKDLQSKRVLPKKWYIQRNKRLEIDKPCKTVTSHCLDELVHPTLNRALTVREVARLQSFPDKYDFRGGPLICPHISEEQDKYEQIGDAVPPLVAYHWGKFLTASLNSRENT